MNNLLRVPPPTARAILAGGVDRLPSVGPGMVPRNIVDSGVITVVRPAEELRTGRAQPDYHPRSVEYMRARENQFPVSSPVDSI